MTATYYERFYPHDMDGVVAYVAPNDVVNEEDSAYDRFFANVGTKECRDRLNAVQREALVRREPLEKKYAEVAAAEGYTFDTIGSLDKAYEAVVLDYVWGFWQYSLLADCDSDASRRTPRPRPTTRSGRPSTRSPASPSTPTRAWSRTRRTTTRPVRSWARRPSTSRTSRRSYIRYGYQPPRNFVPRDIDDEVPAARDAGRRHLGPQQRQADALRLRRRTTRGAPSVPPRQGRARLVRLHRARR